MFSPEAAGQATKVIKPYTQPGRSTVSFSSGAILPDRIINMILKLIKLHSIALP